MQYHQQPSVSSILEAAWQFIAQNWKQLLICYMSICTLFVLTVLVFNYFNPYPVLPHVKRALYQVPDFSFNWSATEVIRHILGGLSSVAIAVMTLVYVKLALNGQQPAVADVWAGFKAKYPGCFIAFALFDMVMQLGFKLYYLPGIYLAPVFCLFIAINGFEDLSLADAVKKSFVMIWDNWWLTFGVMFIALLLVGIPFAIIRRFLTHTLAKPTQALVDIPFGYVYDFLFIGLFVVIAFCYLALKGDTATVLPAAANDELDPLPPESL